MPVTSVPVRSRRQKMSLEVRDQMVLEHMPLVKAIAIRVHETLPVHVDLDDMIHAGVLGLFDAVTKYDSSKNVAFHAYAKHRIKGAILDSLRQADWASRDLRQRQKKIEVMTRDLTAKLDRTPSESELAQELGVTVERWRHIQIDLRTVGLAPANTPISTRTARSNLPPRRNCSPTACASAANCRAPCRAPSKRCPNATRPWSFSITRTT
jgi:RNA polymerase sigma factor FliA